MSSLDKNRQVLSKLIDRMGVLISKSDIDLTTAVEGAEAFIHGLFAKDIREIIIPKTVTKLGSYAVSKFPKLHSVVIPKGVTTIEANAFTDCPHLTVFCEEESRPKDWDSDFIGVGNLFGYVNLIFGYDGFTRELRFRPTNTEGDLGVSFIHQYDIEDDVLHRNATSVIIPRSINGFPVTFIEDYAFSECGNLIDIVIPNSITAIGEMAFSNNNKLKTLEIPDSVRYISCVEILSGCTSLEHLTIPFVPDGYTFGTLFEEAVEIENQGDVVPESLKTVTITGGNSIGNGAFYDCSHISRITIPASITSIGELAFYNCERLQVLRVYSAIPPQVTSESLSGLNPSCVIEVPTESVELYKSTDYWSDFEIRAIEEE